MSTVSESMSMRIEVEIKKLASDSPAEYDAIIKAARELKAQAVERIEAEFRAKAAALAAEAQALGLPMRRRAKKAKESDNGIQAQTKQQQG